MALRYLKPFFTKEHRIFRQLHTTQKRVQRLILILNFRPNKHQRDQLLVLVLTTQTYTPNLHTYF